MDPRKIKVVLHDDLICQILLWLPVISLLRFKNACRSWHALIESSDFIKQHLRRHHYDPSLKDKNHNLICLLLGKKSFITFPLTSNERFEDPTACLQLNCSDLHGCSPVEVLDIVSYNGIVCLNLLNCKSEQSICLWNPATKQSRVLPQSPALTLETKYNCLLTIVGFGFDVKNNAYKVVNLCKDYHKDIRRVEVYSLNSNSWRTTTTVFSYSNMFRNPRMPFNNGACFFWNASDSEIQSILCFDFSSEKFRCISFPDVDYPESRLYATVVSDKIACVFNRNDYQTEIWVFNEYGSVNESWVKLYTIDPYSTINRKMRVKWLSMNGNYLFFRAMGPIIRYNVVTKEIKNLSIVEKYEEISKDCCSPTVVLNHYGSGALVEFKESLLSVGKGNNEWKKRKRNNIQLKV